MKTILRSFTQELYSKLISPHPLIQVLVGPRQVGKTTGVKLLLKKQKKLPYYYVSADGSIHRDPSWIMEQWLKAKEISPRCVLVIDEIQKVERWSEAIKDLWDSQNFKKDFLRVIVLGSSSLELHRGLSESLAGRYYLHQVYPWDPIESKRAYNLTFEQYLQFGGYPGSYFFIKKKSEWLHYIQNSIIDAVIGKDILSEVRVKSPSLFKQCFEIACHYAAQEISYTKLLGQLQDKGNVELVKHYLELFEKAYLIKQIFKFSNKKTLSKSSSPKLIPTSPALYSVTCQANFDDTNFGRAFELLIGALLLRLPGELYYWRNHNLEVDFVYKIGKELYAIEVKWGNSNKIKGLYAFKKEFPQAEPIIITKDNYLKILKSFGLDLSKN
jgi:hypothetical protein